MVANAFTCTGPYAILILLGLKRVENRSSMPEDFETIPAWDEVKDWSGKVVGCCDYEVWNAAV